MYAVPIIEAPVSMMVLKAMLHAKTGDKLSELIGPKAIQIFHMDTEVSSHNQLTVVRGQDL